MAKKNDEVDVKGITVKKSEDIASWYEQVCLKSEIVEFGTVKGTMVIRPRGYYVWEKIQEYFNKNINDKFGVENAYFPLFVPESFFAKEAEHAEGFSPEVAWIDKELTGEGERLAIRPTSETIMYDSFSGWIRSYKDLPLKVNQWCNIVRWETKATKLFLRSREFLWQEGHCVYENESDCEKDVHDIVLAYQKLAKDVLALPMIVGRKTEKEKFAGAKYTYSIEGFMPDGKALQCGTTHHLAQNFSKAFGISYVGRNEKEHLPWQNSWGISTRLIGAMVMTHSDDKGLVLPPKVARNKVVIVPLLFKGKEEKVLEKAKELEKKLKSFSPILDDRSEYKPGYKFSEWEMKGVPIRLEIGPKDLEKKQVVLVRRDNGEKIFSSFDGVKENISKMLEDMHNSLYEKAKKFLDKNIVLVKNWEEFIETINQRKVVKCVWCGETECEELIKDKTGGASSRCMPLDYKEKVEGVCPHCGKEAKTWIYFSKSY